MRHLKRNVWNTVQSKKLDPLDVLDLEESDDEFEPDSEDQFTGKSNSFERKTRNHMKKKRGCLTLLLPATMAFRWNFNRSREYGKCWPSNGQRAVSFECGQCLLALFQ